MSATDREPYVGTNGSQPGCELLAVVEAQGNLLDPGVVDHVGDRPEGFHARTSKRRGHEGEGSRRHLAILAHS